jgi:hypothetical protein
LRSIRDSGRTSFKWVQTGDLESNLVSDDSAEPFATLRWAKNWGSLATGLSGDGSWTFKRSGFLHPRVTVRESGSNSNIATFLYTDEGKGVIEFPNEAVSFSIEKSAQKISEWIVKNADLGEKILTVNADFGWTEIGLDRKIGAHVEIEQSALQEHLVSLLALFAWYIIILTIYDDYSAYMAGITTAVAVATTH